MLACGMAGWLSRGTSQGLRGLHGLLSAGYGDLESMADTLGQVVVVNDELRGMYRQFLAVRLRTPRLPSGDGAEQWNGRD
jgi:hypothetical protein